MKQRLHRYLGLALVLVAVVRVATTYRHTSQLFDEPCHAAASIELLDRHTYKLDPVHPPLARLPIGVPLYLAGERYPHLTADEAAAPSYNANQGGHEQIGINASADQLAAAGFTPFSFFGANGYRNNGLFFSVHVNGQNGAELTSAGPFTNIQGHIDVFNPGARFPLNIVIGIPGHGIWDLGIGSLFFSHSNALDPACH